MGITWVDIVIVGVVLYFIFDGWERGFVLQLANLAAFLGSLWLALRYQSVVGNFFTQKFGIPQMWTNVLGYLAVAFATEIVLEEIVLFGIGKLPSKLSASKINHALGAVVSICSALVTISFFLVLILAFPLRGTIKADIQASPIARFLVTLAGRYGGEVTSSVHDFAREAAKFTTIEPGSNEQVQLHLPKLSDSLPADTTGEAAMVVLVNKERAKEGLGALEIDARMTAVAEAKSRDMFANNYFAHTDLDGNTIADRMEAAHIPYQVVGENLAYAPDTQTAHSGLMDSPGHKANILDPKFHRVGIGVIDGGVYGKMYTQVFAD